MVKKSLMKIDPNLIYSGSNIDLVDSGTVINVTTTNSTDLTPIQNSLDSLSGTVSGLDAKLNALQETSSNYQINSGTNMSEEDTSVLSAIRGALDSIMVEMRTVTFTRSVIFESLVTFKDKVIFEARVTFSDPDMAGKATITSGSKKVHIEFTTPYIEKPIVTIAPN